MGRVEEIRAAIDEMSDVFAKDVLATLLTSSNTTSVFKNAPLQASAARNISNNKTIDTVDFANFAQAITYLKTKYKFKELSRFSTEADLVYVDTGDRRVLLTDREDPARFTTPEQRRPIEDSYSSEDEFFNNAFEPAYHRPEPKKKNTNPVDPIDKLNNRAGESVSPQGASVPSNNTSDSSNNPSQADPFASPAQPAGNSRFSNLEL